MSEAASLQAARGDWPIFGLTDDVRPALERARRTGSTAALATLYAVEGGAPRGLGAQMLVTRDDISGYISGGCVEADIALQALDVIADGRPRHLIYGRGGPVDIRLPCGGRMEILLEAVPPDDPAVAELLALAARRVPAILFSDGRRRTCFAADEVSAPPPPPVLVSRRFDPVLRLAVLGADPFALALCTMAVHAGYDVALIRPNGPDDPPPVPGLRYLGKDPAVGLREIGIDPWTAVAVAMHDEVHDHEALKHALPSAAFYVGLLGSRRSLARKVARLKRDGMGEEVLRLKAPIGLPIGGFSPWMIATAVMAEIMQTREALRAQSAKTAHRDRDVRAA